MRIGEAYRVDQDASAHRPFDPRDSATWGQGGQAPLLIYDLSFGATHGIAFAGSGGFKTVSVCVPSLLSYRGSIVTLDPSTELEPMLRPARQALGHRVVAIDPARPAETGFNVLDWLDPKSATADADVHAVVDWVCGERRAATADAVNAAGQFFEGRGKAMVEALLSDLIFDPALSTAERTLARLAARLALPEKDMRTELERIHKESASARARHLAGQLKQLVKETFSGVYGNMSEQTEWLANPRFAALVSGSAFHTRELADGKLDLFLNIPMKVLETTPALARCIVGALLNAVYEADGKLKSRVLFLLDEVARLGFMASLARARDAGRKYGITLVMSSVVHKIDASTRPDEPQELPSAKSRSSSNDAYLIPRNRTFGLRFPRSTRSSGRRRMRLSVAHAFGRPDFKTTSQDRPAAAARLRPFSPGAEFCTQQGHENRPERKGSSPRFLG